MDLSCLHHTKGIRKYFLDTRENAIENIHIVEAFRSKF